VPPACDLLLDAGAELEAGNALRKAGKVLDALGVEERAARAERIEEDRAPAVARSDERRGEPGGPAADDGDLVVDLHALCPRA
jgi:hypothetical protein